MSDCMQDVRFVRSEPHSTEPGKLKGTEDYMRERDQLDGKIAEIECLTAALAVVAWQLGQVEVSGEVHQLRNAVIGISRALDREVERQG